MAATCAEQHRLKMWEVQLPCTNLVMWKVVDGQSQTRKLIGKTGENGGKRGKTGENGWKRGKTWENGGNWGKTGNGMVFQREATWLRLWFTSGTCLSERPDGDGTTSVRRVNTSFGGLQCLLGLAGLDSLDATSNEFSDQVFRFSVWLKKDGLRMFETLPIVNCNDCLCRRSISKILSWGCSPCFFWHTPASCRKC